jgi:hypothetical protein
MKPNVDSCKKATGTIPVSSLGNINNLAYYHAARLLDTTSDDLGAALDAVRRVWEERTGEHFDTQNTRVQGATESRVSRPDIGPGVNKFPANGVRPSHGVRTDNLRASGGPISWGTNETTQRGGVRHHSDPRQGYGSAPLHSAPPNKSSVNAQTLKSLTLFDTYIFDGRRIGDVRRGELKGHVKRGKLAEAILAFGEAPDDFKVRDILKVKDLRKILLEVGEVI